MSQRTLISTEALTNWYTLLWNIEKVDTKCLDIASLEESLLTYLHKFPRDDNNLVVGLMKTWALSRKYNRNLKISDFYFDFAQLVMFKFGGNLNSFLDCVALIIACPVPDIMLPPEYRSPAEFQNVSGNIAELNHAGIMILFSVWHIFYLDQLYTASIEVDTDNDVCLDISRTFTLQDLKILDNVNGCLFLPSVDIYRQPTECNIYIRIKESSLTADEKYSSSTALFDFNPENYKTSLVGMTLQVCKQLNCNFIFGDHVLWSKGIGIWIQQDIDRKTLAIVENQHVIVAANADERGLMKLYNYMEKTNPNP